MDKAAPKSPMCSRPTATAPRRCSTKLSAEGIGHMIDGKVVPSVSGANLRDQVADRWRGAGHSRTWQR